MVIRLSVRLYRIIHLQMKSISCLESGCQNANAPQTNPHPGILPV